MSQQPELLLRRWINLVALVYHEARNVRWLVKKEAVDKVTYSRLTNLATNKFTAWQQLRQLRDEAAQMGDLRKAVTVFERRFDLTLDDLAALYLHQGWRDSALGGNRWAAIAESMLSLLNDYESGDDELVFGRVTEIESMAHNTGVVDEKLRLLEAGK